MYTSFLSSAEKQRFVKNFRGVSLAGLEKFADYIVGDKEFVGRDSQMIVNF
jgi:hypothetical protein